MRSPPPSAALRGLIGSPTEENIYNCGTHNCIWLGPSPGKFCVGSDLWGPSLVISLLATQNLVSAFGMVAPSLPRAVGQPAGKAVHAQAQQPGGRAPILTGWALSRGLAEAPTESCWGLEYASGGEVGAPSTPRSPQQHDSPRGTPDAAVAKLLSSP
eukprot:4368436-Pyramimonas_sp.AAC.1